MLHVHFVVHVSLSISEFVKLTNHSEAQKWKTRKHQAVYKCSKGFERILNPVPKTTFPYVFHLKGQRKGSLQAVPKRNEVVNGGTAENSGTNEIHVST